MRLHVITSATVSRAFCVAAAAQPIFLATDPAGGSIIRSNLADTAIESVLKASIQYPRQLSVDLEGGKMYWISPYLFTGQASDPYRSNLSGLSGLALDAQAEKLYWIRNRGPDDRRCTTITRVNLDGYDQEEALLREGSAITELFVIPEFMPTAISQEQPSDLALFPAYPNPFNPATTLPFVLTVPSNVTVKIRDVLGRVVDVLVDEPMSAGLHNVIWEPDAGVPSGAYFYTLESGTITITRSVLLLR